MKKINGNSESDSPKISRRSFVKGSSGTSVAAAFAAHALATGSLKAQWGWNGGYGGGGGYPRNPRPRRPRYDC